MGGLYDITTKGTKRLGPLIGYGKKSDFSITTTRDYPSPLTYFIKSPIEKNLKEHYGPTMRLKFQEKKNDETPGPGSYHIKIPKNLNTTDVRSRLMFFYDIDMKNTEHCISPQKYYPTMVTQENGRHKTPSFGLAQKFMKDTSIFMFSNEYRG